MKILVFHQHYLTASGGGGSRFNEFARFWADAGHQITVVAGTADYASGDIPDRYRHRWLTREWDGAVEVVRCFTPSGYARSYARRMISFAGFTFSAATAAFQHRDADVVIATSPPLLVPMPAWIAARLRLRPAPLIFEIRDLWPESAITTGVISAGSLLARGLYALERWACQTADCINVLTPAFREDLLRRGLAPAGKIALIPNGADVDMFSTSAEGTTMRAELGWGGRTVFLYAGAHGRANALEQLIDAAALLADREDILIACVGEGPQRAQLEERARQEGLRNIVFHGPRPKSLMPAIVAASDVGVAVLQDNPTFRTVYPNKIFDYMACARPVLLAVDGVARELVVDTARAGVFAAPNRPDELAAAIRELTDDRAGRTRMGASGFAWVRANATRSSLAARYLSVMEHLPKAPQLQRGLPGFLKALFDRTFAFAAFLLLSPLLAAIAFLVARLDGPPILFRQARPGLNGKPFEMLKFRTMRGEDKGSGSTDEHRLTRLGRILRQTSLDELPQLWNVLAGDLSLVGPRPLLLRYLPRYTPRQARRHLVRPGMTGWAQVNGRNALDWAQKLELDVWYVEHWSLWLDLRILCRTLARVLQRSGISREGHATMPEFKGENTSGGPDA